MAAEQAAQVTGDGNTLAVIDYAAAKSEEIAAWLRALVHDLSEPPAKKKVRLLLIERLGGESMAWWLQTPE